MSWWSDLFSSDSGDSGGDDSWWGALLSGVASYADSEESKKKSKKDRKHEMEMLKLRYALEQQQEERRGGLLKDAYAGYSKYYTEPQQNVNPMQAFGQAQQNQQYPQGLLQYANQGGR